MATTLNTHNPEHITWKHEQLLFTVLGGIRLEGLDRMRITIKIDFKNIAIRHNLDLYNDTQVEKLIRKTAERLSIGTSYISKAIAELINELENYRLEEIQKQAVKQETRIDALTASFLNPFKSVGVEGVETPVRTSYSTEMDFSMLGQRVMIDALATYKQWKVDNNLGNDASQVREDVQVL